MSGVGFLDKLLDGVEVEWKPLGELGELVRGNGLQKKDFTEAGVPAIHYGQIYTYYGLSTTETKSFVAPDLANQLKKVDKGDVVITNTSENLEDVGKALVYLGDQQAVTGGHASILKPGECLLGKYLAYFTQTEEFFVAKRKYAKGAKVIDVSAADMAKIQIPIPCPGNPKKSLEIQAEIVRILDTFTELTAELTAELTNRKKQYNHYRDQLLSFEDGEVEWIPLGDVAKILNGYAFKSSRYSESGIRVIRISDVQKGQMSDANPKYYPSESADEIRKYLLAEGDLVMSLTGNAGRVAMLSKIDLPAGLNQRVACIRPIADAISTRYLFHFLNQDCFESDAMASATGGGQKNMSTTWLASYLIPVPSPQGQRRIVTILDKFDALTHSLTEGLPREIELRQKQYAYYRDLLLSFPKPARVS